MAYLELAIDLGTSYTSIFQKGKGLILREPSVVIAQKGTSDNTIKAIGIQAKKMIGKTSSDSVVIFPIFEGTIANPTLASAMLEYFLSKIITKKGVFRPKIKAVVNVVCGLMSSERKLFENVVYNAGVHEAYFVEAPICSAYGVNATMETSEPIMVVDIGGGTTDISVLSQNAGVIAGCSIGIGGNNVDTGIIDYLVDNYSLKVGLISTERVKNQVASLNPKHTHTAMINGRDTLLLNSRSLVVTSRIVFDIVNHYYNKIFEVIESTLKMLPEEVSANIYNQGIYLCGGASQVQGIDYAFDRYLNIGINTMTDPNYATIMGAGKLLSDQNALKIFAR